MPKSGIAGSYGISVFNFIRSLHKVLHNGCTSLHPHQQFKKVPFSPRPLQQLYCRYFNHGQSDQCEVLPQCGFDLHFSYTEWCWATFLCLLVICISSLISFFLSSICSWVPRCIGEGNDTPIHYSCLENPMDGGSWWAAVHGVATSWKRLSDFTFTFLFHALEKEMAIHSSVLAWRIPGTGEPGGLPSMRSHRVGHDWSNLAAVLRCMSSLHILEIIIFFFLVSFSVAIIFSQFWRLHFSSV